ncbi:hypothetical protein [Haloarcula montana]|uniref:hypothetical protein n=1 Tax=Haloarcula montana TaxID=3111776 RepID=UPI002D79CF47|nr:hypothetical protein [Haloarcula sp. GH36]
MERDPIDDKERLLFGAGFVFGAGFILLVLGLVIATMDGGVGALGVDAGVLIGASVFATALVGTGLFLLAFPENRVEVPVSLAPEADDLDKE